MAIFQALLDWFFFNVLPFVWQPVGAVLVVAWLAWLVCDPWPAFCFTAGVAGGFFAWWGLISHWAANSDVTVRGAIYWVGGMVMPIASMIGGLIGLGVRRLVTWWSVRRHKIRSVD